MPPTLALDANYTKDSMAIVLAGVERNLTLPQIKRWERETNDFVKDFWNNAETHRYSPVYVLFVETEWRRQERIVLLAVNSEDLEVRRNWQAAANDETENVTTLPLQISYAQTIGFAYRKDETEIDPTLGFLNDTLFLLPMERNSMKYANLMMNITESMQQQIYFLSIKAGGERKTVPDTSNRDQTIIGSVVAVVATSLLGAAAYIVYLLKMDTNHPNNNDVDSLRDNEMAMFPATLEVPSGLVVYANSTDGATEINNHVGGGGGDDYYRGGGNSGEFGPIVTSPSSYRIMGSSGLSEHTPPRRGEESSEERSGDNLEGMVIRSTRLGGGGSITSRSNDDSAEDIAIPSPSSLMGSTMPLILSAGSEDDDGDDYDDDDDDGDDDAHFGEDDPFQPHLSGFQMEVQDIDD
jgi:hypothetical protein